MRWLVPTIAATIAIAPVTTAHAPQRPIWQRIPDSDSTVSIPDLLEQEEPAVGAKSAAIANVGSVPLSLSYWDGASWKEATIASGAWLTIECGPRETETDVSFNDGSSDRREKIALGVSHALYWSDSDNRWELAPFVVVRAILLPNRV